MKAIKISAVAAPLGEMLLCAVFLSFGRISFGSGETNLVGYATIYFHTPGLFLAEKLFGPTLGGSTLLLTIGTGVVQFFLLIWGGIALQQLVKRHTFSTWMGILLWVFVGLAAVVMVVLPLAALVYWGVTHVLH